MTRILQITDTHIVAEGARAYGVVDTAAALAEAVATANRLVELVGPIDLVIVTGDLVDHGLAEEYRRFAALIGDLAAPVRVVPGNHDARGPLREILAGLTGPGDAPGDAAAVGEPVDWACDLGEAMVIGLDSSVPGKAHGALAPRTLAVLDEALDAARGRPVLVGLHHPPFATGIVPMDAQALQAPEALIARLSRHDAPVHVACGHVHRAIMRQVSGIGCTIAPAPAHAVALDYRADNPNGLMLEPGGMMLHDLRAGGFVAQVVPVGRFAGPYPFIG